MGQLVEVLAVAVEKAAPNGPLLGANIDAPQAGRRVAAAAVEIGGWALGRTAVADEIEVTLDRAVVARAPLGQARPDIAESFPEAAEAASAGFELVLDASRAPAEAEFEVRARVGAEAVPIGSLRLRRSWREATASGEPRLISVVLACQEEGEALGRTIGSLREQRYWPTELLISHPASLDPSSFEAWRELGIRCVASAGPAAALRNEGIRRSNGQLLV
ncbi:MAG TPA: hypothetical protein VFS48_01470, partial [Solirubrobacterales bacterium]|nr:hypothetical protein [Solirubrobacterales bacterium]